MLAVVLVTLGILVAIGSIASAGGDTLWVDESNIAGGVVDSELAEDQDDNDCEDVANIPGGSGPGWARVGGAVNPHHPLAEVSGQILDPHGYLALPQVKTNAFVTHTDLSFNHFARDINVFLTPDPADRHFLAHGNFVEGDRNEHGELEIEWERGGVPMFAFPAIGDRLTVWGPHIFDCGHGDTWVELPGDDDTYRTEIHPPHGWVLFRQSADRYGGPENGKQNQSPWQWYEGTDLQGAGESLPNSALLSTNVQATVADAYFTTYGGNAIESLNGCDDFDDPFLNCYDYGDRPELSGNEDIDSWEWHSPILDQDYSFVVPAPPVPAAAFPDATMEWHVERRCSGVPPDPTKPNRHDHREADEDEVEGTGPTVYSSDRPIGNATCNPEPGGASPYVIDADHEGAAPWNDTGRPAIRMTVRAKTGHDGIDGNADDPTYPANDYLSFAYRVKVGWDYAPPDAERVRTYRVDYDTLRVYDDGEPCSDDGEWIMSLRANDQYIHPVIGTFDDDNDFNDTYEPMWESETIDDDKCDPFDDPEFKSYELGTGGDEFLTRFVTVLPGEKIEIWERAYDKDDVSNDDLSPTIREFLTPPSPGGSQSYVVGNGDTDVEMSHTIVLHVTDVTPATPSTGTLTFGDPQYGPNADTAGRIRVSGETRASVAAPAGTDGIEYRVWRDDHTPGVWHFDRDGSDGFTVNLPPTGSCVCVVEWATIDGVGADAVVSERTRQTVEIDNLPPELTVPDDFSVYANQTEGARVEYEVSATDDFSGPIDIQCSPRSGDVFPNGRNAPRATTVTCTATDTVENETSKSFDVTVISPVGYVNDYGLLGIEWLAVSRNASVLSGNVGVFDLSNGIPRAPGLELQLDLDSRLPTDALVAAHTASLGARVIAGEVLYVDNLIAHPSATYTPRGPCDPAAAASLERCAYVPLWSALPTFLTAAPGSVDLKPSGSVNPLGPGSYGSLDAKPKAVVTLAPGAYSFASIHLKPNSRLEFTGPTTVRVRGRLIVQSASVAPLGAATARDLVFHVAGGDQPPNKWAVDIAPGSILSANVYGLNGTVVLGNGSTLRGAVIGRRISLGSDVTVIKESAFSLP